MSAESGESRLAFAEPLTWPVIILLAVCTAIFLLQMLVPGFQGFALHYLALDTAAFLKRLWLWQAVTSLFLHGDIQHWLGNMIFLWFFGSALAAAWRRREFLVYYFLCGVVSSLCFYLFNAARSAESIKGLGASGAIFGLMIAYAMIFGERIILAFFLIPMQAKYFVALLFGIELLLLWTGTPDGIGHITHISGAVAGAIYLKAVWRWQERRALGGAGRSYPSRIQGLEVMADEEEGR